MGRKRRVTMHTSQRCALNTTSSTRGVSNCTESERGSDDGEIVNELKRSCCCNWHSSTRNACLQCTIPCSTT